MTYEFPPAHVELGQILEDGGPIDGLWYEFCSSTTLDQARQRLDTLRHHLARAVELIVESEVIMHAPEREENDADYFVLVQKKPTQ